MFGNCENYNKGMRDRRNRERSVSSKIEHNVPFDYINFQGGLAILESFGVSQKVLPSNF